jgi:hypothetical protein
MKEDGMISSQELQILDLLRTQAMAIENKDTEGATAPESNVNQRRRHLFRRSVEAEFSW